MLFSPPVAAEILSKTSSATSSRGRTASTIYGYWFIFDISPMEMSLSFLQYSILPGLIPILANATFCKYWIYCSPLIFNPTRFLNIIGIELLSFVDNIIFPFCFMQSKLGVIIIGDLWPPPLRAEVELNLCSLSLCYHLLVGVDDIGNLLGVFADVIGKGSAL